MERQGSPSNSSVPTRLLTLREVADFLAVKERTVYRLAKRGLLPGIKVGGQWRFQPERLEDWLKNRARGTGESNGER